MRRYWPLFVILFILVGGITFFSSAFIIKEGRQAIITQFGKPIGDTIKTNGLHFKLPFVQKARFVDKRILSWDGHRNQIPTKDKKYIWVDTTARFQIFNALKFIQTVQNLQGAKARLDGILDAATRDVISQHNLVEAVRNTNSILKKIAKLRKRAAEGDVSAKEKLTGQIEKVQVGRQELSHRIVEKAQKKLEQFGVNLIDVQLRRIAYEESVETKVYERMISERERIAEEIRSVGRGEQAKIEGERAEELERIQSEAYQKAQKIRGEAEAKATEIYADAMSRDPQFFEFLRKMEAYEESIKGDAGMILSTDSEFLDLFGDEK